ncbi:hypothetical protein EJ08DRAFT_523748 [Tothia fuscella]|uniref:Uncharacterized protein n=1 Tax=Tothia fuscella TaxID=1048955 RepID=A0A9P4NGN2_9PEZI|nr:hypothetical protein EJ08DRAFT_523748 [Tothia fuscella]
MMEDPNHGTLPFQHHQPAASINPVSPLPPDEPEIYESNIDSEEDSNIEQVAGPDDILSIKRDPQRHFEWTWQILSALLSVAGLMGTIILLIFIDKHPRLADWTLANSKVSPTIAAKVSPNTLIAVFSAISKGAMLIAVADGIGQLKWIRFEQKAHVLKELERYDEASRGSWGAVKLIVTTKHTALLASLGALVTILSLVVDPFAQQIISNVSRNVVASNGSAIYQVAQTYDTGVRDVRGVVGSSIDARMQGAIFNGIYLLDAPDPVTCTTANCAWPDFTTLAICSSCTDVSSETVRECGSYMALGGPQQCNYTTPGGHNFPAGNSNARFGFASTRVNSTAKSVYLMDKLWNDTLIIDLAAMILPDMPYNPAEANFTIPFAKITECSIRWCAQVYESTNVTNNVLNTTRIRNVPVQMVEIPEIPDSPNFQSFSGLRPVDGEAPLTTNDTFVINTVDHGNTATFLTSMFTVSQSTVNQNRKDATVNDISNALIQTNDVALTVKNLVASMSTRIRTGPQARPVRGQAFTTDTFIQVQWVWLIVPCAVVLSGCLFLALTILRCAGSSAPVWKSSMLAVLLHDVKGQLSQDERFNRVGEMNKMAGGVQVKMMKDGSDRWTFERI